MVCPQNTHQKAEVKNLAADPLEARPSHPAWRTGPQGRCRYGVRGMGSENLARLGKTGLRAIELRVTLDQARALAALVMLVSTELDDQMLDHVTINSGDLEAGL